MNMGLNDSDVERQIKHMIAFIDQEADEKVEEIRSKAKEEFEIEKGKLLRQQRLKIVAFYERKEKQLEQHKKIQQSQLINAARLKILKCREDHIQKIMDEARDRLSEIQGNKEKYTELLTGLIAQGLFHILEDDVIITCMKKDVELVKAALPDALAQLKDAANRQAKVTLNKQDFLTADSCGGVEMANISGSIRVRNTLDARLQLIGKQMMPEIRVSLFGKNENRKFLS